MPFALTNAMNDSVKDAFWGSLRDNIERVPRRKEIIIMEDMNARVEIRDAIEVV